MSSYTAQAAIGVAVAVILDMWLLRTRLLTRRVFWTAYVIVLAFQLLVNGILTGRNVVRYDDAAILGARIAYAPVEDLLFGFALVTATLSMWIWVGRRQHRRQGQRQASDSTLTRLRSGP